MPTQRFKNSPFLFGEGSGTATYGDISCEWCGTDHTGREDPLSDESICVDNFGNKQVLDCCYGEIEKAVLQNMDRIIPWYIEILKSRQKRTNKDLEMLAELKRALDKEIIQ